jgi:hypothetical protein
MSFLGRIKWLITGKIDRSSKTQRKTETGITASPNHPLTDDEEMSDEEFVAILRNHPIFSELREWEEYRIKVLEISDPIKRNMAKFYLGLFFSKFKEAMETIVQQHRTYLDDTVALNKLIIETINDVRDYASSVGVPEVFLDKFTNYLYTQTKIFDSTCKDLDRFEYYNNPLARATFRLDLQFLTIRNITSELESVINDMNGELHTALEGSVFDE